MVDVKLVFFRLVSQERHLHRVGSYCMLYDDYKRPPSTAARCLQQVLTSSCFETHFSSSFVSSSSLCVEITILSRVYPLIPESSLFVPTHQIIKLIRSANLRHMFGRRASCVARTAFRKGVV